MSPLVQQPTHRRLLPLWAALFLFSIILTYWPGIDGEFVWDDIFLIRDNPDMKELGRAWQVAWGDYYQQGSDTRVRGGYFRPLPILMNSLTVHWFGLEPTAFHVGNLALHCLAVWLAFIFLIRRGLSTWTSFWVAAFFAIHPLQTETVLFISCRSDLLAAVGLLGALVAYEKARQPWSTWMALSILCFGAALLSKEIAIGLPVILFWLERTHKEGRISRVIPFVMLAVAYVAVRLMVVESGRQLYFAPDELPIAVVNLVGLYLSRALWPMEPHLLYDGFPITHLNLITALGGIAIVVCLVLLWRLRRIDSGLGLGLLFSITFILPVLHIVPLGTIAAERYLYLPLFGVGLASAKAVTILMNRIGTGPWILACGGMVILSMMMVLGHLRSRDWRNEVTLWQAEIASQPQQFKAYANLGSAYAERGEVAEASRALHAAWTLNPGHAVIFRNLVRLEATQLPLALRRPFVDTLMRPKSDLKHIRNLISELERRGFRSAAQLARKQLR